MNYKKYIVTRALRDALVATIMVSLLGYASYLMLEPMAIKAQTATANDLFIVNQTITSEISFLVTPSDVTLASIGGITGGDSEGSTGVRVYTNDSAGFTMSITASNSPAMVGYTQGGTIADYTPATANTPDYTFASTSAGESAEYGYTISASTTSHLAQKFLDNGSNACNSPAGTDTNGKTSCWYNLSTTATSTLVTTSETAVSGATSTLYFRVHVPANPSPALPEDIYYATSTLTATTN